MASSSMVFGVYAPQPETSAPVLGRNRLRAWMPALAFTFLLAIESSPYLGADHTSAPLQRVVEALFGYDVCVHWEAIHHLIRKTGHFIGYGAFSLICFRALWITLRGATSRMSCQLRAHGSALLLTFVVAAADEFHQSYLPNRTGQFSDVLLDTCGGVALCLALFLMMQMVDWIRNVPSSRREWVAAAKV
ncbi:MAG: VanZ family protein [Terracidiphilus sp.]